MLALLFLAMVRLEITPERFAAGLLRLGTYVRQMLPPDSEGRFWFFVEALVQTLGIAFAGTLTAAILAAPVSFLAARNIVPNIFAHFAVRRGLDVIRSVDALIWALIWINVVGLGPFAGVLAIICVDFGGLGKLFSEAIEATDARAGEGVISTGGNQLHRIRFALIPQVLPVMASQVLYFFESNVRSATIIGIVGAGGVGQYLAEMVRMLDLQPLGILVFMILVTVAVIDLISSRIRLAIIGRPPRS
ncbi:phosphonate transport system permease protein [Labrys monachus]|uniref:Phosphonate transport system permease protein n=2 Tax=Labrys monachus TaxID=217067 RepID=A0ABU0FKQ5_9HYPH|nr:phosphonate transport system permease protein [Labrys monachus]